MPEFIVKTYEHVQGTYRVTADTVEDAQMKFGDPDINWDDVEQLDYMAFSLEVDSIEKA